MHACFLSEAQSIVAERSTVMIDRLRTLLVLVILLGCSFLSTAFLVTAIVPRRGLLAPSTDSGRPPSTALAGNVRFKNFDQVLHSFHNEPVVVYFSTENCIPCQRMKKELASLKVIVGDSLKLFKVDTEKWPQIGPRYEVSRLPCLVIFQDGEVVSRMEGFTPAQVVAEKVKSFL